LISHSEQLAAMALRQSVPAIFQNREFGLGRRLPGDALRIGVAASVRTTRSALKCEQKFRPICLKEDKLKFSSLRTVALCHL